jgi:hypothetical protein
VDEKLNFLSQFDPEQRKSLKRDLTKKRLISSFRKKKLFPSLNQMPNQTKNSRYMSVRLIFPNFSSPIIIIFQIDVQKLKFKSSLF